jgi:hypothetical protein
LNLSMCKCIIIHTVIYIHIILMHRFLMQVYSALQKNKHQILFRQTMCPWKTTINQSSGQTLKIAQRQFHQITSLVLSRLSNDCHGRRILGRGRSFSAGRKDDTTPSTAASPRTGPATQRLARSQWQAYLIQSATHIIDILMI